jgi:hypothetical protein
MRFGGRTQGPNWAVFSPPRGRRSSQHLGWSSQQVGWSGGGAWVPRRRGGAPGGPALTFAPGRAAGPFFFRGVPSEISGWIERVRRARLGPAKNKKGAPLEGELQHHVATRRQQHAP